MCEHVITISEDQASIVYRAMATMALESSIELQRINRDRLHNSFYWDIRIQEAQKDVEQFNALERIFKGAKSITIKHEAEGQ